MSAVRNGLIVGYTNRNVPRLRRLAFLFFTQALRPGLTCAAPMALERGFGRLQLISKKDAEWNEPSYQSRG
ncbi:MAG: hypothetical protein NVS9B14_07620 [Candidatus Acidiferrum sp.]